MKSVTTILFVENDAVALTMYQKRLQREGFHVEVAEDGIAALKVLSEMTPDVVVLDLMLPKFSGRDVFDYMRADAEFKDIPVIIFSNATKADWPKEADSSPTRALPKSEANFAALLELIREMSAAGAIAAAARAKAAPQLEPAAVLQMENTTSTANAGSGVDGSDAAQFLDYAVAEMPVLREQCLAFIKAPATEAGRNNLSTLVKRLHALNKGAQKAGCARLSLLTSAWQSLLTEIERKPNLTSPSVLQTLAQAADCLRILLNNNGVSPLEPLPKARVLSVDDDEICNNVAVAALQRANMDADSVQDANAALDLLGQTNYDLVLLDINMPGLTGFELCEKLRALPTHLKTPVIFVTAFNNFENRKQSVLSGGGDLIAKPVSPLELALKVTIHLLKAPPKPVAVPAPVVMGELDSSLVWKEPAMTISHDTEMFLRGVNTLKAAPSLMAPTTETQTAGPEMTPVEAAPIEAASVEAAPIETPAPLAKAEAKEAIDLSELVLQPAEESSAPKPSAPLAPVSLAPATPIGETPVLEAPVMEMGTKTVEAHVLESVAMSRSLPDEGKVVPTQPPVTTETAPPISTGRSKESQPMTKENNPQFDTLVLDVAHIIFGDNAPDINVRLVRMALEQVWANRANLQSIEAIAREIARIIFGEANASDLNVRLVKMALENSSSITLFKAA